MERVRQLGPRDAEALLRQGALLVDVREGDEWEEARIPGARWLPMSEMQRRWQELPRDRPLILQCAVGGRSLRAAEFLAGQGFPEVCNLAWGIRGWHREGLPVDFGPPPPAPEPSSAA